MGRRHRCRQALIGIKDFQSGPGLIAWVTTRLLSEIMSRHNIFENILSAMVVLCAAGFLVFLRMQTGIGGFSSYEMNAELAKADGLAIGTDVRIAGVKVGRVADLSLEPRTYHVKMQLEIRSGVPIPTDSRLSVSGGTMSSTYLNISPGRSLQTVPSGGTLGTKS